MSRILALVCALAAFAIAAGSASAPALAQQATPPYGSPITLDDAKRAMAAAELEAAKNSWQVAITILDSGGNLVMFHKVDNTQLASSERPKARRARRSRSSARARCSTTPSPPAAPGCACWRSRTSRRSRAVFRFWSMARLSARSAFPGHSPHRTPKSLRPEPKRWQNELADTTPPARPDITKPDADASRTRTWRAAMSSTASQRAEPIWLINSNIPEYQQADRFNHAPKRPRKLLLHCRSISKLIGAVEREGMTLVPLKLYFNEKGRAKIELALARGKKLYDKRENREEALIGARAGTAVAVRRLSADSLAAARPRRLRALPELIRHAHSDHILGDPIGQRRGRATKERSGGEGRVGWDSNVQIFGPDQEPIGHRVFHTAADRPTPRRVTLVIEGYAGRPEKLVTVNLHHC